MFNQTGQTVGKQINVGYTVAQVNKMLRHALALAAALVPDDTSDSIRAGTADIIKDTWKFIDD